MSNTFADIVHRSNPARWGTRLGVKYNHVKINCKNFKAFLDIAVESKGDLEQVVDMFDSINCRVRVYEEQSYSAN